MTYFGIDWGMKKIGVSVGDSDLGIASPFCVVKNLDELFELIKKEEVSKVVLGAPVKMSGEKKFSYEYEEFLTKLKKEVEVILMDERLTTAQANILRRENKKASDDELAAMLILQSYFDKEKE